MKDYEIVITETLKKTVTVQAENPDEAIQKASDAWHRGEYILDAESFQGVDFQNAPDPMQINMSYQEMSSKFHAVESRGKNEHLCGYIVFTADSFSKLFTEYQRTYVVSSDNKAFQPNMGGYSIYGSSLDGEDRCVRLERYMAAEKGGADGWKIERCYVMQDDLNRVAHLLKAKADRER